ncbi:MAG: arginine--tRNA ligase, partial [Candidatus Thermoplasmatota archaeon]|nr:arginine--tRNA ligase [Candidatus Thermoplasmatota archaeon]
MSQTLRKGKESLISNIEKVFKDNDFPKLPIDQNPIQGDLSIICFPGAQVLKKSPEEVANIVSKLVSDIKLVKKVSVVKAFCNIYLDWDSLVIDVFNEISKEDYGRGLSKNESILVEHTSANATGPFHMGRARNPIIGDSISRLLKYNGYDVTTEYYVNDTGRQAATVAFGIKKFKGGPS